MEEKIGVFICTGYGISEALDIEALSKVASGEKKVPFVQTIESCEQVDIGKINDFIKTENLTKIAIAGVSSRLYEDNAFPQDVLVEKIALREHVVWTQKPNEEETQEMAEDYLRMYIAKLEKMEHLEPFLPEEEIDKKILVVGGGITGLTAAFEAAQTGYEVKLAEKSGTLGGWLGKQHKSIPTSPPFRDLAETGIEGLIASVTDHPNIEIFKSATTGYIEGAPGLFDVKLVSTNGAGDKAEVASFRVGSIVQATGWEPVDPGDRFGYNEYEDIIRNVELESMVKDTGKITRPSDGKAVKTIAFLQCCGSDEEDAFTFCSSICDMTSIKQALYLREQDNDSKAYIFYEFLKTPGLYEDFYRRGQDDDGLFFTKGNIVDIKREDDGSFVLTAENTMPGEKIQVKVDLVVLATGMKPNSADGEAIRKFEDAKKKSVEGDSESQREAAAKTVEELKEHENTEILNLDYRQGPDLPTLENGYPDSHFICFPYESRRTGIYPAGSVRMPMDGMASREDGTGAALKAIQCVEMISRGEAVHPRAGDRSYPDFFMQRCTQCKRCTEDCPFGVLNEDEKGTPLLQATRCRRCGTCLGACPERIISFKDYSIASIGNMIKSCEIPEEWEEKPRILAFMCENDAMPALDMVGQQRMQFSPYVRVIPVRCLGAINSVWVTDAISAGFDGVILIGCKYGDDYQCHFCKGSELAFYRGDNIREKLEQMQMENQRMELHEMQISEYEEIPKIFNAFEEMIEEIGMNPFKL